MLQQEAVLEAIDVHHGNLDALICAGTPRKSPVCVPTYRARVTTRCATALVGGGMDLRKRAWAGGMREALTASLERAQAAGAVRRDVGIDEVMAVLAAASRAVEFASPSARGKTIEVLLDGLRSATRSRRSRK